ncbi:S8 family serine peptidase [Nonomuraea sp. B10E15]|uniref:S8 family serine peptidase n=1 Tax=Nonomuraea sp. B10E15 TaxID=3153560 RepID=UPI00325E6348
MHHQHLRLPALLAGAALVLALGASPGHAAPPGQTATGVPATAGQVAAEAGEPLTITLITGDVVTYTPVKDGVPKISIQEAPRPGGTPVSFATLPAGSGGRLVLPSDAAPLVSSGTLDETLFDVDTLAREGRTDRIPLLVTYRGEPAASALPATARALAGAADVRPLPSIDGAALTVKPADAGRFWNGFLGERPALERTAGGIAKLWLDRQVTASLDKSVPLIGAPAGWEKGFDGTGTKVAVLDTGIDAEHPDLAGKIAASENFSTSPSITDKQGHGTHVASTIAGSGSASGGTYKGVAPGASLLIGKVLGDNGRGEWSWAIAGMEWAAEQGADVVNLSLGSCCGDGTDPMSQAVDELTRKHGTLFVAAAGNAGQTLTVDTPAAAGEAVAVGSVDKDTGTSLSGFSSKGPRLYDAAVKPNIVAPGDGIVAALSSASSGKPYPGNERYTAGSGTSMATPHVAGAAAILAQQHPGWDAGELRDALTSTAARDGGHSWFEQGSGRVDVARAVAQQVFATWAVDFRVLAGEPVTRQVTYRNTGNEDVTLSVAPATRGWSGRPAPEGAVRLSTGSVTVPANGSATVDVTVDPAKGEAGAYGGWITASGGGAELVTPFSYYTGLPTHQLTVSLVNSYGFKEFGSGRAGTEPLVYYIPTKRKVSPEDPFHPAGYYTARTDAQGNRQVPLPAGEYEVVTVIHDATTANRTSMVIATVTLDGDRTVTLDARDTVPIRPVTKEKTEGDGRAWYVRTFTDRNNPVSVYAGTAPGQDLHVTPVGEVPVGEMRLSHGWRLDPAALTSATAGRLRLDPVYDVAGMHAALTEERTLPVVSVGQGREADFQDVDVAGKLVLAGVPVPDGSYRGAAGAMDQAAKLAAARGAAGFAGYLDADGGRARAPYSTGQFLGLGLSAEQGRALRAAVDARPVSMRLVPDDAADDQGPVYRLRYDERDRIPRKAPTVDTRDLVRIDAQYHADQPGTAGREFGSSTTDEEPGEITYGQPLTMPLARTEYFGPVDDKVTWSREITNQSLRLHSSDRFTRHDRRQSEHWFKAPLAPGAAEQPKGYPAGVPCVMCRDGDRFVPLDRWSDSDPRHLTDLSTAEVKSAPRLFAGDREIPVQGRAPRSFTVPGGSAAYRLESVDTTKRTLSPKVSTEWSFASSPPSGTPDGQSCSYGPSCAVQPAILLSYDLPLDLLNRARAGQPFTFEIGAGPHGSVPKKHAVKRLEAEYSVDDGATWLPALTGKRGQDRYQALVVHPPLSATSGYVSLRVTASNKEGATVTQTIERAYALK